MVPAATPLAQTPVNPRTRLGCIYFPHGATMDKWTPAAEGAGFELSEILQPLARFRDRVNVISNLSHPQAYGSGSATANHNRSAAAFLSGSHARAGAQAYLGITVDQVATVTWPAPAGITYGTPLDAGQLNASASMAGTFAYDVDGSPATAADNTLLTVGSHTLTVQFTPSDGSKGPPPTLVRLTVDPAPLTVTANDNSIPPGTQVGPVEAYTTS